MENMLTVDVEDVRHARYADALSCDTAVDKSFLDHSLNVMLDLFDGAGARATFFFLGEVAAAAADLVRLVRNRGHEIASHGYYHRPVYSLDPEEFREDLSRSIKVIQDITGEPLLGFRAPYWSITEKSTWALDIIKDCGLKYDSSISPSVNFLYGIKGASRSAYFHDKGFWEIPPTTCDIFGKTLIAAGGFYLRALPYRFTKNCIMSLNRADKRALVYLHPHEIIDHRIENGLSFKENFILNFNKKTFRKKLSGLLADFRFIPLKDALGV